jgi:P27 family predicted phage terminase small subunit
MKPKSSPPKGLSDEARKIWRRVHQGWELDGSGVTLLQIALESFDEMRGAQALIKKHGIVFITKSGQIKKNPASEILKVSRAQFLHAWKMLGLDLPAPKEQDVPDYGRG